jgi:hypothetical protein
MIKSKVREITIEMNDIDKYIADFPKRTSEL